MADDLTIEELLLQEKAIKAVAELGECLIGREDVTKEVVDAWHVIVDFFRG